MAVKVVVPKVPKFVVIRGPDLLDEVCRDVMEGRCPCAQ